jgi:hypothetical protein
VYQFIGDGSQIWTLQSTIIPPDSFPKQSNLHFGYSSAMSENWLAVSAVGYGAQ